MVYAGLYHYQPLSHVEYLHLADAFLRGSTGFENRLPQFIDLVPAGTKWYLPYGIMPALLLLPAVAVVGTSGAAQAVLLLLVGSGNVALTYRLLGRIGLAEKLRRWGTALYALGTGNLLVAAWGGPWFLMHGVGNLFLLLGLNEVTGKKRWFLVGIWCGCAVLSRHTLLLTTPFFLILLLRESDRWSSGLDFLAGLVPALLFTMWYNLIRFDDPFDTGYAHVMPDRPYGMFDPGYLARNLKTYFLARPERLPEFPWLRPSPHGISLFLATPALVYAFFASPRDRLVLPAWMAVAPVTIMYLMYFWDGFVQFSPRFLLDVIPFLMLLVAIALRDRGTLGWPTRVAIAISVALHLWGLAWWRWGGIGAGVL